MSIITWCTHPEQKYDSFYMYDRENGDYVRIRLELGRKDGTDTYVIVRRDRYVGFSFDECPLIQNQNWHFEKLACSYRMLSYGNRTFFPDPIKGICVYDSKKGNPNIHFGNKVCEKPSFPVEKEILESIADKFLKELKKPDNDVEGNYTITGCSASPKMLIEQLNIFAFEDISALRSRKN